MSWSRGRRLAHPLPLPKDTVVCGELVLDPSQPQNDVFPYPSITGYELDVKSETVTNIHDTQGAGLGFEFRGQLMSFLSAQAQAMRLGAVEIKVPRGTISVVRDSGGAFKKACSDEGVRHWLEEHVIDEGRKAAMIVGMRTYSNATYVQAGQSQVTGKVSTSTGNDPTQVPDSQQTSRDQGNQQGPVPGPASGLSASAAIGAGAAAVHHKVFNIPGEQIFAVEYKRVVFDRWSKKKLEKAKLEPDHPNRWEVFLGDRSKGRTGDQEENIVEFKLATDDAHGDGEDETSESEEGEDDQTSLDFVITRENEV